MKAVSDLCCFYRWVAPRACWEPNSKDAGICSFSGVLMQGTSWGRVLQHPCLPLSVFPSCLVGLWEQQVQGPTSTWAP